MIEFHRGDWSWVLSLSSPCPTRAFLAAVGWHPSGFAEKASGPWVSFARGARGRRSWTRSRCTRRRFWASGPCPPAGGPLPQPPSIPCPPTKGYRRRGRYFRLKLPHKIKALRGDVYASHCLLPPPPFSKPKSKPHFMPLFSVFFSLFGFEGGREPDWGETGNHAMGKIGDCPPGSTTSRTPTPRRS